MVHELVGPVSGSVSQNCVWSSWPPGELKQQVLAIAVVFWQLWTVLEVTGHESDTMASSAAGAVAAKASTVAIVKKAMMLDWTR